VPVQSKQLIPERDKDSGGTSQPPKKRKILPMKIQNTKMVKETLPPASAPISRPEISKVTSPLE
jgi:hypothetical protein